jgi:SecD/SecF fusion protein
MTDTAFERDLRAVLDQLAPSDVPVALRSAVVDVPYAEPDAGRPTGWSRGRRAVLAGLGAVAALLVLVVLAVVVLGNPLGLGRMGGVGGAPATPTASPTEAASVRVEYQVRPAGGRQPTSDDLSRIASIVSDRLSRAGIVAPDVATLAPGRLVVTLPGSVADRLRTLIGTTGRFDFVPLGQVQVEDGQTLDLAAHPPLFSGDQVTGASIGSDQTGQRTIDFVLGPEASAAFAAYTAAHVGDYFAIVLDGTVISAPVLNEPIPGGRVQISQNGIGGFPLDVAQDLVDVIESGALPFPISEVSVSP